MLIVPVWNQSLWTRKGNGVYAGLSPSPKAGEDDCLSLSLKTTNQILHINGLFPVKIFKSFKIWFLFIYLFLGQAEKKNTCSVTQPFCCMEVLTALGEIHLHWRWQSALQSPDSVLISPRNMLTYTARNNVWPSIWAPQYDLVSAALNPKDLGSFLISSCKSYQFHHQTCPYYLNIAEFVPTTILLPTV